MKAKAQQTQNEVVTLTEENSVYADLCSKINLQTVKKELDFEKFQNTENLSESSLDERIAAAVNVFLKMVQDSSQKIERLDKNLLDFHISRIDQKISEQLEQNNK